MAIDLRLFLYEQSNFFTLASILEPLSTVDQFLPPKMCPAYEVSLCSIDGGEINGPWGCHASTQAEHKFAKMAHTFVICGGWGYEAALTTPGLVNAVRRQALGATRLGVAGGGLFIAAEAGLLANKTVAAHPTISRDLAMRYPGLKVDTSALLLADDEVLTCPGMSSAVDMALTLIEADWGYWVAVNVARHLVVYKKRSLRDKQTSEMLTLQARSSRFGALHDWVLRNLNRKIDAPMLADVAGMSVRNFTRTYRREIGVSPAKMVETLRVQMAARSLLESDEYISVIATKSGFNNDRTFLRAFQRHMGMPPTEYREKFAGKDCAASEAGDADML